LEGSNIIEIVENKCISAYYSLFNNTYVTLYSHETCIYLGKLVYDRGTMYKIEDVQGVIREYCLINLGDGYMPGWDD